MKTWLEYINEEAMKAGWRVSDVQEHHDGRKDRYSVGVFPPSLDSRWYRFHSRLEVEAFVAGVRAVSAKGSKKAAIDADV